jgi:hypothetical protein
VRKVVPAPAAAWARSSSKGSLCRAFGAKTSAIALAGVLAATVSMASTVVASASAPGLPPISAVGPLTVHTGFLGSTSYGVRVAPQQADDLLVLAVINDTWADHVVSVSGGDVASWSPAGAPFYDGGDGHIMQIWYGQASSAGAANLMITWNGRVNNADIAVQEFTAGAGASWSGVASGSSSNPFPALNSPVSGDLYIGAALAWGDGAAGTTPGIVYTVPSKSFVMSWDTDTSGVVAPTANGAGSVAALFTASAPRPAAGAVVSPTTTSTTAPPTTTTVAPTTTTTGAPSTTTTAPSTTTTVPATTTTVASTTTSTTSAPANQAPANQTPASQWPNSLFNKDVGDWSVDPNSAEFASDVVADYEADFGAVGVNTMPIYSVPADQADVSISVSPGCNDFTRDTGTQAPIPPYAALNGSSDNPLVIYQPSTSTEWEFWQVVRDSSTSYSACWAGKLSMATSDGVFPFPYGMSATGISYLATTVTESDVESGAINHAIAVILPHCNYSVYPADRTDCTASPGQPGEGQWFRFPPGTTCPATDCTTPFAQMVFNAIQTYGMVVVDQGGAVMIEAEQQSDWAAQGHTGTDPITASWDGLPEYQVIASLPWSTLQTVDPPQ